MTTGINVEKVKEITSTCYTHAWSLNNIGLINKSSTPENKVVDKTLDE